MGRAVAVGPAVRVAGWSLAGVEVRPADSDAEVRTALADLPTDLTLLIVTQHGAAAIAGDPLPTGALLAVLAP